MSLHCRRTHECLDASAQGGGKELHVLGSVPEPAGDGPPGAVMSGDRGGGGTGWGRRQSRCLADGAAARRDNQPKHQPMQCSPFVST